MERRGIGNQIGSSTGQSHHANGSISIAHPQQNSRVNNSFIPTSATYHNHSNGHAGKQIPTSAMQNHVHNNNISNVVLQHPNNFYSNAPPSHNPSTGTMGNRHEHHYTNYQQTVHSQQQYTSQQMHQRTLTKSYSSHNQQSHYGNTTGHANNSANHNTYYGNTANLTNGTVIINGHHGTEKSVLANHHNSALINPVQQTYNHQQVLNHQQVQQMHLQVQGNRNQHQTPQLQQYLPQSTNQNNNNPNSTEGLPPTLVESMRTLFDILDDTKQGKIRLSDIETRWESDTNGNNGKNSGAEPLIKMGVLEYLRKVTPPDGMLTFDRFCSGLRLALLTNNNDTFEETSNHIPLQKAKIQHQNPPQQSFQEHIKNMTNSAKASQNGPHIQSNYNVNVSNINHHQLGNKSSSAIQIPNTGQNNTIQRMSRIPNLSASRLPMPNGGTGSGIPVSPNNRLNGPFSSSGVSNIPNTGSKTIIPNNQNTIIGNLKRYPLNSEQGTTVALVHPQPPPNPKPVTGGIPQPSYLSGGTLKMTKQNSTPGLQNRFSSRNSSMDDLKAPSTEQFGLPQKERPPSAPILDIEVDSKNLDANNYNQSNNKQRLRERAKSQERDRGSNANNNNISRADEKSNFVKSRQRTLSMPQLQLNKLKPKSSVVNFDDNSPEKIIPSPTVENNYPRPSALKNSGHSHSKLIPTTPSSASGIPTFPTMPSTNSLRHTKKEILSSSLNSKDSEHDRNDQDSKEFSPPPPKPPRNAMSGPVTISTTLVNGVTQDPPLSGSSFGSGQTQSSSVTISLSGASSSGGNSSKPEIRNVLHSWQKSMTDKKPVEAILNVTNVSASNSTIANDTTISAPSSASIPAMGNGEKANPGNTANQTTSDDVKLRTTPKTNLRRKETARRHTVQSGIDFSTLKRLKQLEQERDVLQQGLSFLQQANDWYTKQLETADDKIGLLNKGAPTADYWSESHEERLNLLGCRISEVNSLLTALMDGSSRLPLHMNLQIPSHLSLRTITRLKDQNRQLTHEVSDYSHRVTQLENEKAMLLRQLFHQKNNSTSDETVYM